MLYVLLCVDDPQNGLERRAATRPDHLTYLEQAGKQVRLAGPLLAEDGETPIGSLLIIEADSLEAAQGFADADPYSKAGVFANVNVRPFKGVVGGFGDGF